MKLFWSPKSRAQRAIWLLEEAGVNYDLVSIDVHDLDKPRDPDFAKASPMGKVPAIADGETMIAESAAICIYVADKYKSAGLAPAIDDPNRGQYLYWMVFTPGVVEPAMSEKFSGATPNKLQNGWGDFATMIDVFEKGLDGKEWLVGDKFSAADIMCGSSAAFLKQFGILPDSKILADYAARCEARPAFQKAKELSA